MKDEYTDSDIEIAYDSAFESALHEGERKISINCHYLSLNGMMSTHSLGNAPPGLAFPILQPTALIECHSLHMADVLGGRFMQEGEFINYSSWKYLPR